MPQLLPSKPDDIVARFMQHWKGSDIDLAECLECFYEDIRGSFDLAMGTAGVFPGSKTEILVTVDDYVNNHYFL
jgi:hypothetical protein